MKVWETVNNFGKAMAIPHISIFLLRVGMGIMLLTAGLGKLFTEGGWSAGGYLLNASYGPFKDIFAAMANNPLVDGLVVWGLILSGIALIIGAATRWSALAASLMILFFYLTQLPPEHGWITDRLLYILSLNLLAAARAGTFLGVDGFLESWEVRHPPLRYVLG